MSFVSRWYWKVHLLLTNNNDDIHISFPLVNFANSQYFTSLCLPQIDGNIDCLTALIDTGSYHIVIPSSDSSHGVYRDRFETVPFESKYVDLTKIKTVDAKTDLEIRYGDASTVLGVGKKVTLSFNPSGGKKYLVKDQFVLFAKKYTMSGGKHNVVPDIYLGISVPPMPHWYQKKQFPSFIENFFMQHPEFSRRIGLYLTNGSIPQRHKWENRKEWENRVLSSCTSILTLGSLPHKYYKGDMVAFRNPRPYISPWLVEANQIHLKSSKKSLHIDLNIKTVLVDSGTSMTRVKVYIWHQIASYMKKNHGCYVVPSGTMRRDYLIICSCEDGYIHNMLFGSTIPTLSISLIDSNGITRDLSLSTEQLITVVPVSETSFHRGKCYVSLMAGSESMKFDIILGMNWIRSWATELNLDTYEISFARSSKDIGDPLSVEYD